MRSLLIQSGAHQSGAQDVWDSIPLLHWISVGGPWALTALAAFLLLRAAVRARRYRAIAVLGSAARDTVRDAMREAEKHTRGEIVPVVLERSDDHPSAAWCCALASLLIGSALLERYLPWSVPEMLLLWQLGLGTVGYLLARLLPDLARLFVSESRATEMAEEQALQEFALQGLRETKGRTGVLILVSLFERRVVVLGDAGIHEKVGSARWQETRDLILDGVARGSLADGLVAGIQACGRVLAEHFPVEPGDISEVADHLIVRAR